MTKKIVDHPVLVLDDMKELINIKFIGELTCLSNTSIWNIDHKMANYIPLRIGSRRNMYYYAGQSLGNLFGG